MQTYNSSGIHAESFTQNAGSSDANTLVGTLSVTGAITAPGGIATATTMTAEGGAGIVGTAETYTTNIVRVGNELTTTIYIDLTGLNSSSAADIIGKQATAASHLGAIAFSESGAVSNGYMVCLETPTGGEPDVDLYSATEDTGVEDAAITGLAETALLNAAADWTVGISKALTAVPVDGEYLYLVGSGGGTDATYTAGRFMIVFKGYLAA